eukprot:1160345-Pelagomonas_calceolata.AAC.1
MAQMSKHAACVTGSSSSSSSILCMKRMLSISPRRTASVLQEVLGIAVDQWLGKELKTVVFARPMSALGCCMLLLTT